MSITDELRAYIGNFYLFRYKDVREKLDAIADRIDAEHEAKVAYWQEASYKDGYDEGFASADDWLAQHEDAMAEHGWVKLPKDADGEYIHIGDELRDGWHEQNQGEVERLMLDHDGWWLKLKTSPERFYVHEFHEWHHRHHKPPTVEDVLREFAEQYAFFKEVGTSIHPDLKSHEEVLRQFAAKLRLAGDAE